MKRSVKIGLLDSGIANKHAAMKGAVIDGWKGDFSTYDDLTGHGTACAYIIQEMSPLSRIYNVKIFDDVRVTSPQLVIDGIRWCLENEIDVINLSLAIPEVDYYYEFVRICTEASEKNLIIVAAADNLGRVCLPAYLDNVFGVGAASFDSEYDFFYVENHPIQLYAKGNSQRVADHKGGFKYEQGTSLAAAHMTAIIASTISEISPCDCIDFQFVAELLKGRALLLKGGKILIVNEEFDFQENTKKNFIKSELSERIELIDKAVFLGSNSEVQLFRDYEELLKFDLVGVVEPQHNSFPSPSMWFASERALESERVDYNINEDKLFDAAMACLSKVDTLILGHVEMQDENFTARLLSESIQSGKNVFSLGLLQNPPKTLLKNYVHRPKTPWISWPHVDENRISELLNEMSSDHILNSQILVLGIVHISEQQSGKFNIELMLRQQLLKRGHKIRQIGSSSYSELFGCDYSFYSNYFSPSFSTHLQVAYAKLMLETINNIDREAQLIIVSCGQAISPKSFVSNDFFDTHSLSAMALLFGIQADGFIVVVNEIDDCDHVARNIDVLQSMFMTDVLFIVYNSLSVYSKFVDPSADVIFTDHVRCDIAKLREVINCPVFDGRDEKSRDVMASYIIRYFDL